MVYIDENGDRNPDYSLQDHIDYDFHDFAHYEEATGNLSIITPPRWPSGLATPPEDHPQCGWDGEFCESKSLCKFLLVVIQNQQKHIF